MSKYHRLSVIEKRAQALASVREPPVACPVCDVQVMPADLPSHSQRCTGPGDPGPGAKWITHREVMQMGVPRATLSFWASSRQVRVRGDRQDRKYLYRDLAKKIAQRRGFRRR